MAPKGGPESAEPKYIILRAVGGESAPASTLAPKVGPMGLPAKKVGDDIAKLTSQFKGLKITVQLEVIGRDYTIKVLPTASSLIIKALKEPPRDRKKVKDIKHSGSITLDDVKQIARTLRFKSCAKSFQGSVLQILGTCNSVGCLVDKKKPSELQAEIKSGQVIIDEEDI